MEPLPSPFRFHIDRPAAFASATRLLLVQGWCVHETLGAPSSVRARLGQGIHPGICGLERWDVKAVHALPGAEVSGFELSVRLPCSKPVNLQLEAQFGTGPWLCFTEIQPKKPRRRTGADRLRWLRFWTLAWGGHPSSWNLLDDSERAFLVAEAKHRGLLSIGHFEQYAPRELQLETFPKPRFTAEKLPGFILVTPSFNQAPFLRQAALSVLEQTGVRVDYRIQDGGSTDGSQSLLNELARNAAREASVRLTSWESRADGGQAEAICRGFKVPTGKSEELMGYLNSDDRLLPGALAFVAEYFHRHPEIDWVYGHRVILDAEDREIGRWYSPRRSQDDLRYHDMIPQETLFWRRRLWERVGGLDSRLHFAMDWDLLLRFQRAGARSARLPWFLGCFRWHKEQKTQKAQNSAGIPETRALRERALGREVSEEELLSRMQRVQFDSALVQVFFRKGLRV